MRLIRQELRSRMRDILSYLRMLQFIERAGGTVSLHVRGSQAFLVAQNVIHVQKAGVFLHLYNLLESTVAAGLSFIAEEIKSSGLPFLELNECWQSAWAGSYGKVDEDLAPGTRSAAVLRLCRAVAQGISIEIRPKVGSGNLDDRRIEELAKRYGIALTFPPALLAVVKHTELNDLGFLGLVRTRRNSLAHGLESFAEIGRNYPVADLARWSWATYKYLKCLLTCFESYATTQGFRRRASVS